MKYEAWQNKHAILKQKRESNTGTVLFEELFSLRDEGLIIRIGLFVILYGSMSLQVTDGQHSHIIIVVVVDGTRKNGRNGNWAERFTVDTPVESLRGNPYQLTVLCASRLVESFHSSHKELLLIPWMLKNHKISWKNGSTRGMWNVSRK